MRGLGARVPTIRGRLCSQQLRQAGSCRIHEEPESSSQLQRLVGLPPSVRGSGWCACVWACVGVCARAPTLMCPPLHMHAPTYWPRRRREPWLPRMRHLPVDTPHGGTEARRSRARRKAIDGQGAGKVPGLLLIAELH